MASKTYSTKVMADPDGSTMTALEVPFDPKPVFGKVRAPVTVTIRSHTFRTTISSMGGCWLVPLRKSNRDAAGVVAGQMVSVTIASDDAPREVSPPLDLKKALKTAGVWGKWEAMSFTHKREYAEAVTQAKKPETRDRRIAGCVAAMKERGGVIARKAKTARAKPSRAKAARK